MERAELSYWKIFRLIFVIFSLYLMGDAFYRWDGFMYHSSFSEFLPSVALVSVLWSILAVITSIIIWLTVKAAERFQFINDKIRAELIFLFLIILGASGSIVWTAKIFMFGAGSNFLVKLTVLFSVILASVFFTWLSRDKFGIIQEKITPLVWLYGMIVALSIPLVAFYAFVETDKDLVQQKTKKNSVTHLNQPNIILITFDTLTAENMSLYGYDRLTTPFINRWAKEASVFSNTMAASTWTPPTVASLMSGKRVWTHQLYHGKGAPIVKSDTENLPLLLENNGYTTMAFIVNQMHASPKIFGISKNFQIAPLQTELTATSSSILDKFDVLLFRLFFGKIRFYDWFLHDDFIFGRLVLKLSSNGDTITGFPPSKVFNSFLKVIDEKPPQLFFAWIHLYPPHHPYLPPDPYMGMFDASSEFRTNKSQEDLIMVSIPAISKRRPYKDVQSIVNTLRARYDEFIRFSDKQFEDFVNQLQKRDKLKNTIIILSSDHGEGFEHNYVGHNGSFYEEQIHIPLIIKEPGQTEGKVIEDLVEQIDITSTILDFADIQVPSWMEGRSLLPIMRGKGLPPKPVFSMNFQNNLGRGHEITKGAVAVRDGDYKLIYCIHCNNKPLLYNLEQDPDELTDIFDLKPDVGKRLISLINKNLAKANEKIRAGE